MKALHVTDFHYNRRWFDWVTEHADEHDLICCTGDLLDIFGTDSLASQVRWITAWARALPRPLLVCEGNHDVDSKEKPVLGGRWMKALPGAKDWSASGHREVLGQAFVRVGWNRPIPELRANDLIIAHAPPSGAFTATTKLGGVDRGDLNLADALQLAVAPPWLVLSGHVHGPRKWVDRVGKGTFSLNPGMGVLGAKVPNYITVDTAKRRAWQFREGELADSAELRILAT